MRFHRHSPSRPAAATVLASVLRRIGGGRVAELPFDVELWDGSRLPARPSNRAPSLGRLRVDRRAIGHLVREPNQLGLTRAFVAGDLAFDGDLEALLAERVRFRSLRPTKRDVARAVARAVAAGGAGVIRRPPVPESEARPRGALHSRTRDTNSERP